MIRAIALLLTVLLLSIAHATPGEVQARELASDDVSRVWQLEDDYWRFVKGGDAASFEALWHPDFIGWPCGQDHPRRKTAIGDWVRNIKERGVQVASTLAREGEQDFGDVVVVHYRITRVDTYPDGKVEGLGKESKITHTWMNVDGSWLIVGGMCGTLPDSAT